MCCHCESVRVWQSMENKKQQQRKRLDCHDLRSRNDDKGKRRKANGNNNDKTAFFMDSRLLLSGMTKKEENGFIFYGLPRNFFKISRNDDKDNGKGNGKDKTDEKQSYVLSLRAR